MLASSRFLEQAAQPVLIGVLVAPWVAYFTSIVVWLGPRRPAGDLPRRLRHDAGVRVRHRRRDALGRPGGAASCWRRSTPAGSEVLWRLRLPSALPTILAAARYNVGLALAAAYYGEGGNLTNAGLGAAGRRAANQNAEVLWATILATVALGVVFLGVLSVIERVALRWHVSQRVRTDAARPT